jgi:hypothetical protein
MSKSNQAKQPITLNQPTETRYFKQTCIACFVVARAIPRVLDEIPKHLKELADEVGEAWDESGKRG